MQSCQAALAFCSVVFGGGDAERSQKLKLAKKKTTSIHIVRQTAVCLEGNYEKDKNQTTQNKQPGRSEFASGLIN